MEAQRICFFKRKDAYAFLNTLKSMLNIYHKISVYDVMLILDIDDSTDILRDCNRKHGWTNLDKTVIDINSNGEWEIILPPVEHL
jgi:hypothetical protein